MIKSNWTEIFCEKKELSSRPIICMARSVTLKHCSSKRKELEQIGLCQTHSVIQGAPLCTKFLNKLMNPSSSTKFLQLEEKRCIFELFRWTTPFCSHRWFRWRPGRWRWWLHRHNLLTLPPWLRWCGTNLCDGTCVGSQTPGCTGRWTSPWRRCLNTAIY